MSDVPTEDPVYHHRRLPINSPIPTPTLFPCVKLIDVHLLDLGRTRGSEPRQIIDVCQIDKYNCQISANLLIIENTCRVTEFL